MSKTTPKDEAVKRLKEIVARDRAELRVLDASDLPQPPQPIPQSA